MGFCGLKLGGFGALDNGKLAKGASGLGPEPELSAGFDEVFAKLRGSLPWKRVGSEDGGIWLNRPFGATCHLESNPGCMSSIPSLSKKNGGGSLPPSDSNGF